MEKKPAISNEKEKLLDTSKATVGQVGSPNSAAKQGAGPFKIVKLRHFTIDDKKCMVQIATNSAVTNVSGVVTPGAIKVRLVVPLPKAPADKGKRVAWVMSVGRKYSGAATFLPQGFSTADDTDPSASDKILKLDEMLNIVADRTELLGNVLFLTDYPN